MGAVPIFILERMNKALAKFNSEKMKMEDLARNVASKESAGC